MTSITNNLEFVSCLCGEKGGKSLFSFSPFNYIQCQNCDLIYLNPRLEESYIKKLYIQNKIPKINIDLDPTGEKEIYFYRFEEDMREIEKFKTTGRILDIGCGWGYFLNVAQKRGWEAYGIEPSIVNSMYAREKFHLDVYSGFTKERKYPSDFFDVVTLLHTLEHIPQPLDELSEIRRILKPDGLLVVDIPILEGFKKYISQHNFGCEQPPDHLYIFSDCAINIIFKSMGFKIVKTKKHGGSGIGSLMKQSKLGTVKRKIVINWNKFIWIKKIIQKIFTQYEEITLYAQQYNTKTIL